MTMPVLRVFCSRLIGFAVPVLIAFKGSTLVSDSDGAVMAWMTGGTIRAAGPSKSIPEVPNDDPPVLGYDSRWHSIDPRGIYDSLETWNLTPSTPFNPSRLPLACRTLQVCLAVVIIFNHTSHKCPCV